MKLKLHNQKLTTLPGGKSLIEGNCVITGNPYGVTVPTEGLHQWLSGLSIQRALPDTSADDREFLISGISPEGWDQMSKRFA